MKNIFSIVAIALFAFAITSCQKVRTPGENGEVRVVNETYNAEITNVASYTFHLPDSDFTISEDALNASISIINTEDNTYNYTPKEGFVGTETIRLTNERVQGFCGTPQVNNDRCGNSSGKEGKTYYNYEIKLEVKAVTK